MTGSGPHVPLNVAMVAPPWFTVPPHGYGGVENVCADLVAGLVDRGHDGHPDRCRTPRHPGASFVATYDEPPSERLGEPLPEVLHAAAAARRPGRPRRRRGARPHPGRPAAGPRPRRPDGRHDARPGGGGAGRVLPRSSAAPSTWSRSRQPSAARLRTCRWVGTVHNAVDVEELPVPRPTRTTMLLFLGRLHPDKGVAPGDRRGAGGRPADRGGGQVHRAGGAGVLRDATSSRGWDRTSRSSARPTRRASATCWPARAALLFPILWDEPFGMVMIEAMACGTPVVALRRGSVPEVVVDGVTGVVCDTPEQLPDAIHAARRLDPAACREHVRDASTSPRWRGLRAGLSREHRVAARGQDLASATSALPDDARRAHRLSALDETAEPGWVERSSCGYGEGDRNP